MNTLHIVRVVEGVRIARPRLAAHRTRRAISMLAALGACNAPPTVAAPVMLTWSRDTLFVAPELLQDYTDPTPGPDFIGRAFQIRTTRGHILVSDVGSDRIAVLDSAGNIVRWIGSRGQGPGELRGVGHLAVRDDRIFVAEALNGRVSEFRLDGTFVGMYRAPFAAGSLAAAPQFTLTASRSRDDYAISLVRDDNAGRALPRGRLAHADTGRWTTLPGHDLIVADSLGIWVFDQGTGALCHYAAPRGRATCERLPSPLHERLAAYRDERVSAFEEGTGRHVQAAPLAKDMVLAGAWLALLLPLPEMPLVLIDVNDGSLTPALIDPASLPSWARIATSFASDGRSFVVAGDEGIGRLYLSPRRPLRSRLPNQ